MECNPWWDRVCINLLPFIYLIYDYSIKFHHCKLLICLQQTPQMAELEVRDTTKAWPLPTFSRIDGIMLDLRLKYTELREYRTIVCSTGTI